MYRWLIRTRGWRAALSLALAAGFLATPLGIAHVASAAPDPCDQIGSWPGGGETAVGAAPGLDDPHQHCFTCHWLQSLRSAAPAVRVVLVLTASASPLVPAPSTASSVVERAHLAARAPPSAC